MLVSSSREIMGEHRNGRVALVFGWGTTAVMCVAGAYGAWFTLSGGG